MKKRTWKDRLTGLFFGAMLAGETAVVLDFVLAWRGMPLSVTAFAAAFLALTLVLQIVPGLTGKRLMKLTLALTAAAVVGAAGLFAGWKSFRQESVYRNADAGKEQFFGDQRVMVIVPHQDDEINIAGGIMEQYAAYKSDIYPVFITNGDGMTPAQTRYSEALAVCDYIGIPGENAVFLGYGDQWQEGGPHLYNALPGQVMTSAAGKTVVYGTEAAPAFREGQAYTVENLLADLETVILMRQPDVIYCSDYDSHIDHKATTLAFEKVMGKILRENPGYRPVVYKAYAYKTAWYAEADFYETNLGATGDVFAEPYWQKPQVYRWEDRVRLPVKGDTLSRSVFSGGTYETLKLHESQEAFFQTARVVNSDKVFWKRNTNSLCCFAEIQTSSASNQATLLTDFMLLENHCLTDILHQPTDGTWIPEKTDADKQVTVTFPEPVAIADIVLYDNPSEEDNVLAAQLLFDDGTVLETGALHSGGAATVIPVDKAEVTSFSVRLTAVEGEKAGLTEIEAFPEETPDSRGFVKIMDPEGNFAYDYWIDSRGKAEFTLYRYGNVPMEADAYTVSCANVDCSAVWKDGCLTVFCPEGESAVVTLSCGEDGPSDSIYVRNPGTAARLKCRLYQTLERVLFQGYCDGLHWSTATYKICDLLRDILL